MRLRQLAKDQESGRIGCPSVHLDEDTGNLVVQGDGVVVVHREWQSRTAVRIKASIVRAGLGEAALNLDVPDDAQMVVIGPELDIATLPNPLPGERAVYALAGDLLDGLRRVASTAPAAA